MKFDFNSQVCSEKKDVKKGYYVAVQNEWLWVKGQRSADFWYLHVYKTIVILG